MKYILRDVLFFPNRDNMVAVAEHSRGLEKVDVSQAAVAARAGGVWDDEDVRAEVQERLAERWPDEEILVVLPDPLPAPGAAGPA